MAHYVDGFVLPVPKKNVNAYRRMAQKGSRIWREHGALEYRECVGDDLRVKIAVPFPKGIKTKPGETVIFAYIVYKSRAHRDQVNAKVMKDPRIAGMGDPCRSIASGCSTAVSRQSSKLERCRVLNAFPHSS